MQSLSWTLSNPVVVEHITFMTTMSDYRHQFLFLGSPLCCWCGRFWAPSWTWRQLLLLLKWTRGSISMMNLLQQYFYKVKFRVLLLKRHMRGETRRTSDESITNTLLVKKVDRPSFFLKSKAQRSNPFSGMVVTAAKTVAANRALPLPIFQIFKVKSLSDFPPSASPCPLLFIRPNYHHSFFFFSSIFSCYVLIF